MGVRDVARDAQAQPVALPSRRQAEARLEDLFQALLGHAGAVVVDMQHHRFRPVLQAQAGAFAVFQRIVQQVADTTLERQGLARIRLRGATDDLHPAIGQVGLGDVLEQQVEVDRLDVLVDIGVFHALQRALHQQFQLVQVAPELLLQALVLEEFYPQAQAGDRRAQVMGDGAEQLPALVQVAVDALVHGVEGARHLHQFAGAALLQRCRRTAQGQVAGGARQALERTALPMHQQAGEKQQQQAGENDREHLLRLQSLGFQADVRRRHQAGDVQPLAVADADLGHQHRRVHRFQGQRVVRPGTRQLVELQRAVEQAQLVGTDELDL